MHTTKIDIPKKTREKMVKLLQARLLDVIDLLIQSKVAHWNVKGPQFIALHKLFDEVHEAVEDHMDEIAERLVILGGTAQGTVQAVAKGSSLAAYPTTIVSGKDHVDALAKALADFGGKLRKGIEEAGEAGDAVTEDLLTSIAGDIDKYLWFVEAHQQA